MDNLLCDIDRYKQMTSYSWLKGNKPFFQNDTVKGLWKFFTAPMGIVALVFLYLFLSGSLKLW